MPAILARKLGFLMMLTLHQIFPALGLPERKVRRKAVNFLMSRCWYMVVDAHKIYFDMALIILKRIFFCMLLV